MGTDFPPIGPAQRNDPECGAPHGEDTDMEPSTDVTIRDHAPLAVVSTIILDEDRVRLKQFTCPLEAQSPTPEIALALRFVELDLHGHLISRSLLIGPETSQPEREAWSC
jgi:hypothetical protein